MKKKRKIIREQDYTSCCFYFPLIYYLKGGVSSLSIAAPTEITDPRLLALKGRATPEDCNARPTRAFFLSLVEREENFHTV